MSECARKILFCLVSVMGIGKTTIPVITRGGWLVIFCCVVFCSCSYGKSSGKVPERPCVSERLRGPLVINHQ